MNLVHKLFIGAVVGEFVEQLGNARETVEARAALAGALFSEVRGNLGGADEPALGSAQRVDDSRAGTRP